MGDSLGFSSSLTNCILSKINAVEAEVNSVKCKQYHYGRMHFRLVGTNKPKCSFKTMHPVPQIFLHNWK